MEYHKKLSNRIHAESTNFENAISTPHECNQFIEFENEYELFKIISSKSFLKDHIFSLT